MPKYERINLAITDLPPESASRVFAFFNILFTDKQLDKGYFKQEFIHFTIKEQYFICFYIRIYFGSHPGSYLQRWLHQEVNDEGYFYFLTEQGTTLIDNAENLIKYIEDVEYKTLERRNKVLKKRKLPKSYFQTDIIPDGFKIPLYSFPERIDKENNSILERKLVHRDRIKEFNEYFTEQLSPLLKEDEINLFFHNSYSFWGNNEATRYLNLEIDNSNLLNSRIYKIYSHHTKDFSKLKTEYEIQEKEIRSKDTNKIKRQFIRQIPRLKSPTKVDYMKIIYNAFPQFRDNYKNYQLKKRDTTLEQYLRMASRNIISRDSKS